MSIFAKILNAKRAADEDKKSSTQSAAAPKAENTQKNGYRHVPTHAALDSMNIGSTQKDPELQDRIKIENRKIRALSPERAAMIRARQRRGRTDEDRSSDPLKFSIMEDSQSSPTPSVEGTDALQPPRMPRTYRHATFDALVKTRPKYRSSTNSLSQNGRCSLSMIPNSSVTEFTTSLDDTQEKRPNRAPSHTARSFSRESRAFGANDIDSPLSSCLSKPQDKSSPNKGKHVKFLATLEPTIDEHDEGIASAEVRSLKLLNSVKSSSSLVELGSPSSSPVSSSSQEDLHHSIYAIDSQETSDNRVPSSNTSFDSLSSLSCRGTFLNMDSFEDEKDYPASPPIYIEDSQLKEVHPEDPIRIFDSHHQNIRSFKPNLPAVGSKAASSRNTTSTIIPLKEQTLALQSQRAVISPFERHPFSFSGPMTQFQPLSPGMLGVLPDVVPESPSNPPEERSLFRTWAVPPTTPESSQNSSSDSSPLISVNASLDFPTYVQDVSAVKSKVNNWKSKLAILRKYSINH